MEIGWYKPMPGRAEQALSFYKVFGFNVERHIVGGKEFFAVQCDRIILPDEEPIDVNDVRHFLKKRCLIDWFTSVHFGVAGNYYGIDAVKRLGAMGVVIVHSWAPDERS